MLRPCVEVIEVVGAVEIYLDLAVDPKWVFATRPFTGNRHFKRSEGHHFTCFEGVISNTSSAIISHTLMVLISNNLTLTITNALTAIISNTSEVET